MDKQIIEYMRNKGFSDQAILYVIACYYNLQCHIDESEFMDLIKQKIIERDYITNTIKLTILNENVQDIERFSKIRDTVESRVDEYRILFRGIRTKSIGTKSNIIDLLTNWLISNPDYSFNDIVEVTQIYIDKEDPRYISNADNFIKSIDKEGNEISKLSLMIEDMKLGSLRKQFI